MRHANRFCRNKSGIGPPPAPPAPGTPLSAWPRRSAQYKSLSERESPPKPSGPSPAPSAAPPLSASSPEGSQRGSAVRGSGEGGAGGGGGRPSRSAGASYCSMATRTQLTVVAMEQSVSSLRVGARQTAASDGSISRQPGPLLVREPASTPLSASARYAPREVWCAHGGVAGRDSRRGGQCRGVSVVAACGAAHTGRLKTPTSTCSFTMRCSPPRPQQRERAQRWKRRLRVEMARMGVTTPNTPASTAAEKAAWDGGEAIGWPTCASRSPPTQPGPPRHRMPRPQAHAHSPSQQRRAWTK